MNLQSSTSWKLQSTENTTIWKNVVPFLGTLGNVNSALLLSGHVLATKDAVVLYCGFIISGLRIIKIIAKGTTDPMVSALTKVSTFSLCGNFIEIHLEHIDQN